MAINIDFADINFMFVALVNFGLKVYVFYVFCEVSSTVSVHVHVHIGLCQPKTHLVLIT